MAEISAGERLNPEASVFHLAAIAFESDRTVLG
jgi:hypothetical protein